MKLPPNRKVFVDADAYVAVMKHDDANTHKAVDLYYELVSSKAIMMTNQVAIFEAATVISQRAGQDISLAFLRDAFDSNGPLLVDLKPEIWKEAYALFGKQKSKNVSLFDCLHMASCKAENIAAIFSFDRAYKTNGFTLVTD